MSCWGLRGWDDDPRRVYPLRSDPLACAGCAGNVGAGMIDLRLGDCLEILPTLADKSVDAIITDLPYGTTACKWDVVIPFAPMWEQVKRLCKGAFVTTASQPFTSALVMSNPEWFRYEAIWAKSKATGHLDANRKFLKAHENICIFSRNGHTYNPQMIKGARHHRGQKAQSKQTEVYGKFKFDLYYSDEYFPQSVISTNVQERAIHPTQKPVALYEYLIKTYTNPGDTVLDFCMGSGTTGVACVRLNRNFIGIELRPDYFEVAQRRISGAQQVVMAL
jgi:site-specific DNA-methyltransferase (adenine-specific)